MSRASKAFDEWARYGPVPLTRYPNCPRLEWLVRLRCKRTENGNFNQEFVKCESMPQPENVRIASCRFHI
jgi:hypothetical protein